MALGSWEHDIRRPTGGGKGPQIGSQRVVWQPAKFWAMVFLLAVGSAGTLAVDTSVSRELRNWGLPGDVAKAIRLSEAFAHGFGATAILGAVWLVAIQRRSAVWFAVLVTALSGVTANGLKSCFVRIRPYATPQIVVESASNADGRPSAERGQAATGEKQVVAPSFWDARQRSFPSGHTATAWGLAIGLSLVFPRGMWLFGILACMASLQRLTSGAHFPSDVLAGAAIAFACSAILLSLPITRRLLEPQEAELA